MPKLFYYRPDDHGPDSLFVMAETAEDAAKAANAYVEADALRQCGQKIDDYSFEAYPYRPEDFKAAGMGEVIINPNE